MAKFEVSIHYKFITQEKLKGRDSGREGGRLNLEAKWREGGGQT